jgi:hypothetical protein
MKGQKVQRVVRHLPPQVKDYLRRGWCLIPIKEKRPAVRWKGYQSRRPSMNTIRRWFNEKGHGVAVIFGSISGGLVSRDFDDMETYEKWRARFPELAAELPTVETRRGRHVYAMATEANVRALRELIGKPSGTGAIKVEGGELRCGVGCYSVVPPSIHPSGHQYRWIIPLPEGPLPEVDLLICGFISEEELARLQRVQRSTEAIEDVVDVSGGCGGRTAQALASHQERLDAPLAAPPRRSAPASPGAKLRPSEPPPDLAAQIQEAIASTLPRGWGQRHLQVFELCRALQAIPYLAAANPVDLEYIVQEWHRRADPHTSPAHSYDDTLAEFLSGWRNVKHPRGQGAFTAALRRAKTSPLPLAAGRFEKAQIKLLVAVCRELQRACGLDPFYLASRKAAELLGVSHTQSAKWLGMLCALKVLREVIKGSASTMKSSRYHYLGDM